MMMSSYSSSPVIDLDKVRPLNKVAVSTVATGVATAVVAPPSDACVARIPQGSNQTRQQQQQQQQISPPAPPILDYPKEHDVLCCKGDHANNHAGNIGNILLRKLVAAHKSDYLSLPKLKKWEFAFTIVKTIRCQEPEGRFLDQDREDDQKAWYDIGDACAIRKVQTAFRHAPKLRNQHPIEPPPPRQQQPANESGSAVIVDDGDNPRKKCCYYDGNGYGRGSVLTHHSFGGKSFPSSNHEHGFALLHPYFDCEPNRHAGKADHPIHYSNHTHHYHAGTSQEIQQQPGQTRPRYQMAVPHLQQQQQQQQMMQKSSQESSMSQLQPHPGAPSQMPHDRYDQQQQMMKSLHHSCQCRSNYHVQVLRQ
jgi:hypothetical protein